MLAVVGSVKEGREGRERGAKGEGRKGGRGEGRNEGGGLAHFACGHLDDARDREKKCVS